METKENILYLYLIQSGDNPDADIKDDISTSSYEDTRIEYCGAEYLVLTEDEKKEYWDDSLQSYLDECIYPELPKNIQGYFDEEKWKQDARFDGAGHAIACYDGEEREYQAEDGTWFYIYRVN